MRKLATLETILEIKPHNNADALEIAIVRGWQVVVKKGKFKVGEFCVFFEIDSLLPCREPFEFLRKNCYKQMANGVEGFRLKSVKLRQERSQGLIIPLNELFENDKVKYNDNTLTTLEPGTDVTDILEVVKYEVPEFIDGRANAKGNFPSFLSKTNQERCQNVWEEYMRKYSDLDFEVTLKLDGTSATYYSYEGALGCCSRNMELRLPDKLEAVEDPSSRARDTYINVGVRQGIFAALQKLGRNLAIQGELCGPKIQKNIEGLMKAELFIFDIFDIDERRYLTRGERLKLLEQMELLPYHIPTHSIRKLQEFDTLESLLFFAEGQSLHAEVREGLVFKSLELVGGDVLSFKVISNDFLLREK